MQLLDTENRAIARRSLPLPVRIEVRESPTESWQESTEMRDVSAMGGGFRLSRPIKAWTHRSALDADAEGAKTI